MRDISEKLQLLNYLNLNDHLSKGSFFILFIATLASSRLFTFSDSVVTSYFILIKSSEIRPMHKWVLFPSTVSYTWHPEHLILDLEHSSKCLYALSLHWIGYNKQPQLLGHLQNVFVHWFSKWLTSTRNVTCLLFIKHPTDGQPSIMVSLRQCNSMGFSYRPNEHPLILMSHV